MKRAIRFVLAAAFTGTALAACGGGAANDVSADASIAVATDHTPTAVPEPTSTTEPSGISLEPAFTDDVDTAPPITTDVDTSGYFGGVLPTIERDTPMPTPTPVPSLCEAYTLTGVDFESGQDTLTDDAREVVHGFYRARLQSAGTIDRLLIVGHTDSVPYDGPGGNQGLSERRAEAVASELQATGFDPTVALATVGHADRFPVADEDTPKGLALNRRVEVFVQCD